MKEKLIEKIDTFCKEKLGTNFSKDILCKFADYLLADGWFRPPCKVGDKVYVISRYYTGNFRMYECYIDSITHYEKNTFLSMSSTKGDFIFGEEISQIGKTIFLTREEAEAKLTEGVRIDG